MNPSPTSAPALNVNDLNFDTCERLRHLDYLLNQLGIAGDARVLDAGGYPCYMARGFPQRRIITADIYANGHPPYVKASAAALPFPDNTFDATIACDVLEHVPPAFREAFLSELTRVSSRAVIVAGPYATPGAARAEAIVRTLLPESSPAQMWLAEHAECGLPSMDETVNFLHGAGATCVKPLPAGSLTEWMLFFAAQATGERHHLVSAAMQTFIAQYNRLHTSSEIPSNTLPYRHAVVATLDMETQTLLKQLSTHVRNDKTSPLGSAAALTDMAPPEFDRDQVDAYVDSLGALLQSIHSSRATTLGTDENTDPENNGIDPVTAAYISRLETMLSHRGMELPDRAASNNKNNPGQSIIGRLRAAWSLYRDK